MLAPAVVPDQFISRNTVVVSKAEPILAESLVGVTHNIRGIKQMITFRGGRVPERFRRSPCSVVAALVPPAEQMAKRSLEIQRRVIKVKSQQAKEF